jgi:hypothetical protein
MSDRNCPHLACSPLRNAEYCSLKPHEENPNGNYRFVSCDSDNWELCKLILERQGKILEEELNKI